MIVALLASIFGALVGMVIGAATQRWGDADKATHGHKDYADDGSEYGALLAERDRLIASGVDPSDLLVPQPPQGYGFGESWN